jgi:hypothetical protein
VRASEPEESLLYTSSRSYGRAQVKALSLVPCRLCHGRPLTIVRRSSERSAARLAHQSGGLGVPSSNLGAPTNATSQALKRHSNLRTLTDQQIREYTNARTSVWCGCLTYAEIPSETLPLASASQTPSLRVHQVHLGARETPQGLIGVVVICWIVSGPALHQFVRCLGIGSVSTTAAGHGLSAEAHFCRRL